MTSSASGRSDLGDGGPAITKPLVVDLVHDPGRCVRVFERCGKRRETTTGRPVGELVRRVGATAVLADDDRRDAVQPAQQRHLDRHIDHDAARSSRHDPIADDGGATGQAHVADRRPVQRPVGRRIVGFVRRVARELQSVPADDPGDPDEFDVASRLDLPEALDMARTVMMDVVPEGLHRLPAYPSRRSAIREHCMAFPCRPSVDRMRGSAVGYGDGP